MAMSGAAIRAGKAFVEFFVEDSRVNRGLKTMERKFQFYGRRIGNAGRRALAFGAGGALALAFPLRNFASFDDKIKELESLAKRGTTSLQELREQAKQLGRDTSFTAIDVAGGQTEMARAGFDTTEIKSGIEDIMNLARATKSELPRATEIAAGTLRAFQLPITDMTRVVNVAVGTVNRSAIGIEDYAEAMGYAATVANSFGMSIEETSKAVGVLGNLQIKGSMAGTALRNAMMRIADPKIRAEIEKFTPVIDQAKGRIKEISQIMQEIGTANAGEDAAKKLARISLLTQLFGLRSASAAIVLSENVAQGFDDAFNDPKFAENVAKHMDSGIGGALRRLNSMWEGVAISFGEATDSMVQWGAEGLTKFLSAVRAIIDKNPMLAQAIVGTVAALVALGVTGIAIGYMLQGLALWFNVLSVAVTVAQFAVTTFASVTAAVIAFALTPVGMLAVAVAGLAAWFVYTSGAIQAASAFLMDSFGGAWTTIVGLISSGNLGAAFTLAMALVKAAWTIGIGSLQAQWEAFTGGLASMFLSAIAGVELTWVGFTETALNAFTTMTSGIETAWLTAMTGISGYFEITYAKIQDKIWLIGVVWDKLLDKIRFKLTRFHNESHYKKLEAPQFEQAAIRNVVSKAQEQQKKIEKIQEKANATKAERSSEADKRRKEIEDNHAAQQAENAAMTEQKISAAQAAALRARAEFDQAQAGADATLAAEQAGTPPREIDLADAAAQGAAMAAGFGGFGIAGGIMGIIPGAAAADAVTQEKDAITESLGQGPAFVKADQKANEGVTLKSKEGQKAIAAALGFTSDGEKVKGAIEKMSAAVVGELEDMNDNLEDNAVGEL